MNNNSFNSFLMGISKSLKIVDSFIPICKDTLPVYNKVKKFINKGGSKDIENTTKVVNVKPNQKKNFDTSVSPKFFI